MDIKDQITTLKGIGEKTQKLFQKINVHTVQDLMEYYPRDYDIYEPCVTINSLTGRKQEAVMGMVCRNVQVKKIRNLCVVSTVIKDNTGEIPVTFFNMPFLKNTLKLGATFIFRQKPTIKQGRFVLEQPTMYAVAAYDKLLNTMQPIYGLTKGITNQMITKAVTQVLEEMKFIGYDCLSKELRDTYQLCTLEEAYQKIHFPKSKEDMIEARRRLVFEEFLFFILALHHLKEKTEEEKNTFHIIKKWETEEVINALPYALTNAQMRVWLEIEQNLTGHTLMSRLVQGDVGSGKTILAFLGMILSAANGYQSALMVPTEVLAVQHFDALTKLLKEHNLQEYKPVLLTGSTKAKERREIYRKIEDGTAKMIVGTHALIQEKVIYDDLALVITDEQHRFGVKQREVLSKKGGQPHVLVMSATPIPRTLAIIMYGDLDISVIDELPARRLPIKNCVVNTTYRKKAYAFMEQQIKEGRQVYVICPMVEESEGLEAENVTDYTEKLKGIFKDTCVVESLHGQMKPQEKNEIMERFSKNEIQILVSTTVVEVGVNVPNATVMMVEDAQRFGLAQLHQLRGRVGRGEHQSFCIFVQGDEKPQVNKRLEILKNSNDGFYIASEDLKLRGPGDLFGIRQSGILAFKIADIYQDANILQNASEAAGRFIHEPNLLEEGSNEGIKVKLYTYLSGGIGGLGI